MKVDSVLFLQPLGIGWLEAGWKGGTEEGTAWYKKTQGAHRRSQYNSLMLSKSIGVCCEDLVIGCGAGGAPSHIRNIAGNSNRMNEMALTLLH